MRRFSANYIFPITGEPIRNGVIVLDSSNKVVDIIDPKGNEKELASMEFYNGVIVPGFVNSHCHLELSHLKGRLEQSTGIAGFVSQIRMLRRDEPDEIEASIKQTLLNLEINGIVAVGDICNNVDTLDEKLKSKIYFHNFIEIFGLNQAEAKARFVSSLEILNKFQACKNGSSSLSPHSTYSVSETLWQMINDELLKTPSIASIHYGESEQEYKLLKDRSGMLAENFRALGIPINLPDCYNPLDIVKRYIPKTSKILFVHNTFALRDEVRQLVSHFIDPYFVLCPSSNLFIEGKLPDLPMLIEAGAKLTIGTDSFASSNTLSVFDQLIILLNSFPSVSFGDALKWATLNGAKALDIDRNFGSFEIGKTPGLNLITDFDFRLMKPTAKSRVRPLV